MSLPGALLLLDGQVRVLAGEVVPGRLGIIVGLKQPAAADRLQQVTVLRPDGALQHAYVSRSWLRDQAPA